MLKMYVCIGVINVTSLWYKLKLENKMLKRMFTMMANEKYKFCSIG